MLWEIGLQIVKRWRQCVVNSAQMRCLFKMFVTSRNLHAICNVSRRTLSIPSKTDLQLLNITQDNNQKRQFSNKDDYQYIQRSKVPTLHFQPSLPRLPIPELEKTCDRYLASLTPLVNDDQLNKTRQFVQKFRAEDGKALQEELKSRDKKNKHTSYISSPWFDMYLASRQSIVLNYNPFLAFIDDPKTEYNNQLTRSSNMLISAVRFLKSLRAGILEPEVFHLNPAKSNNDTFRLVTRLLPSAVSWYGAYLMNAYPLDMSQYSNLFNATRIPQINKDRLFKDETARHILVIYKGNFFTFDVIDDNGNIVEPGHIHKCLKYILHDVKSSSPDFPVSYLTAEERNTWAKAREKLVAAGNSTSLQRIDSALFALILDSTTPGNEPVPLFRNMLYGDAANRWFDKSFQLIIAADGKAAINFEHSWGDGVAVLRFFNEIFLDSTNKPWIHPKEPPNSSVDPSKLVSQIEFKLDAPTKKMITNAKANYEKVTNSLAVDVLQFPRGGKNYLKKHKLSPDSVMQLAFQMGYFRLTGKTVATYESCSTSAFRHGRTETVRPATKDTKECTIAFNNKPLPSKEKLRTLLSNCSKTHQNLTKNAAMGQGFDRHLFALKLIATEKKLNLSIFTDPSYALINHIILSTSTLSSPHANVGGFGPVVENGLGIGYIMSDDSAGCVVTTYPPHADGSGFVKCVESSLSDIYKVLG